MPITSSSNGNTVNITISGRFDFSVHKEFRDAYSSLASGESNEYIIDMSQTEYVDSSALGMLLLLREHAGSDQAKVLINGSNNDVKEILMVSNFDKLFTIS
ncbi:MAG: STAS domain-containing protein [gamma proteobacterium symbiont of Taylorina sp.]|nr:STAS domain-containing protein [gamma proteobacterium symbiont of Taylorina sp.]